MTVFLILNFREKERVFNGALDFKKLSSVICHLSSQIHVAKLRSCLLPNGYITQDEITDQGGVYYVLKSRVLLLVILGLVVEIVVNNLRLRRPYDGRKFFKA